MKKVANILFLVAAIVSITLTVTWFMLAAAFFVFGSPVFKDLIILYHLGYQDLKGGEGGRYHHYGG